MTTLCRSLSPILMLALAAFAPAEDCISSRYHELAELLKSKPDDKEANEQMGKLLCFEKNQWDPGLFYLAQGSDKKLRLFAQLDLANPDTAKEQIEVGDAWWQLGTKAKGKTHKHLRQRGVYWYQIALRNQLETDRARIEKRVEELLKFRP